MAIPRAAPRRRRLYGGDRRQRGRHGKRCGGAPATRRGRATAGGRASRARATPSARGPATAAGPARAAPAPAHADAGQLRLRRDHEAARRDAAPADDDAVPEHGRRSRGVGGRRRQRGADGDDRARRRRWASCPTIAARRCPQDLHGSYRRLDQSLQQIHVESTYDVAVALGAALTTPARLGTVVGACATDTSTSNDATCLDTFIKKFGARALRRPLDDRRGRLLQDGLRQQHRPPRPPPTPT